MDSGAVSAPLAPHPAMAAVPAGLAASPDSLSPLLLAAQAAEHGLVTAEAAPEQQRPFPCAACGKRFLKKAAMEAHQRTHADERRFSCSYCEMKFKDGNTLRQHVRRHTGERPYKCTYCEKAFKQLSQLNQHKRLHTGERPYTCQFCERTFVQKNHVDRHERTHTGERPYTCRTCDASFVDRSGLNQHMRQHVGADGEPVECPAVLKRGRPRKDTIRLPRPPPAAPVNPSDTSEVRRGRPRKNAAPPVRAPSASSAADGTVVAAGVEYAAGDARTGERTIVLTESGEVLHDDLDDDDEESAGWAGAAPALAEHGYGCARPAGLVEHGYGSPRMYGEYGAPPRQATGGDG